MKMPDIISVLRILSLMFLVALAACDANPHLPSNPKVWPATVTYSSSISPTPIENASARYTDFIYHVRKVGDKRMLTFEPVSNVPTNDNSVAVTFKVTLSNVEVEAEYESYITYKLDGVEQQGAMSKSTLVSSRGSR